MRKRIFLRILDEKCKQQFLSLSLGRIILSQKEKETTLMVEDMPQMTGKCLFSPYNCKSKIGFLIRTFLK